MRFPAALVMLLGVAFPAAAAPVSIGAPVTKEGITIAPRYATGVTLDKIPAGMSLSPQAMHLEALVHATKDETHGFTEGAFMPYLDIHYQLIKDGEKVYRKTGILFPMTAKDGPHYASDVDMAGPGTYHLTLIVSPPTAHGLLRHTDTATGVGEWWKPMVLDWNFDYPAQTP